MQIQEGSLGTAETGPKIDVFGFLRLLQIRLREEIKVYLEFLRSV